MRSIIQDGSDDWPPNEVRGQYNDLGGTIMRSIIQDGSDDWPPNEVRGQYIDLRREV